MRTSRITTASGSTSRHENRHGWRFWASVGLPERDRFRVDRRRKRPLACRAMTRVGQAAESDDRWSLGDEHATRGDLEVLDVGIRAEIAGLRSEISALESRLAWRLLGGAGALLLLSGLADFLT